MEEGTEAKKYDDHKARFDLLPPESLFALAELFRRGGEKYGDRNWERGMRWGRVFAAMMRHAWYWWAGEEYDEEDRQHHLIAIAWAAMVLYAYTRRSVGQDDRHKILEPDMTF